MALARGRVFAVLGLMGSGKSTYMAWQANQFLAGGQAKKVLVLSRPGRYPSAYPDGAAISYHETSNIDAVITRLLIWDTVVYAIPDSVAGPGLKRRVKQFLDLCTRISQSPFLSLYASPTVVVIDEGIDIDALSGTQDSGFDRWLVSSRHHSRILLWASQMSTASGAKRLEHVTDLVISYQRSAHIYTYLSQYLAIDERILEAIRAVPDRGFIHIGDTDIIYPYNQATGQTSYRWRRGSVD